MVDKLVTQLPLATAVNSSDLIHISQGGIDKAVSADKILEQLNGGNPFQITILEESSIERTLQYADRNSYISFLNDADSICIVAPVADAPWKLGDSIVLHKSAVGDVTVVEASGVIVNPPPAGLSLEEDGQVGQLIYKGDDEWDFLAGGTASSLLGLVSTVRQDFVATGAQVVFDITDFTYTPGVNNLAVYADGVRIFNFTETDESTFTLDAYFSTGGGEEIVVFANEMPISGDSVGSGSVVISKGVDTRTLLEDVNARALTSYANALALDPDKWAVGETVVISDAMVGGTFEVASGAISASSEGVLLSNSVWNAAGVHLRRVYSGPVMATWFGAVEDGVTDDTGSINNALAADRAVITKNSSYTTGSLVFLSGGGYLMDITDGLMIISDDNGTSLPAANSGGITLKSGDDNKSIRLVAQDFGTTGEPHVKVIDAVNDDLAGVSLATLFMEGYAEIEEMTEPAAPAANKARLFVQDNGGKTELAVRFPTGVSQVIATEP